MINHLQEFVEQCLFSPPGRAIDQDETTVTKAVVAELEKSRTTTDAMQIFEEHVGGSIYRGGKVCAPSDRQSASSSTSDSMEFYLENFDE